MSLNIIYFKGIKFYNFTPLYLIKKISKTGGYLVAPAASSLSTILDNRNYYNSIKSSNIAILDSGFFCILLRLLRKKKIKKLSGYLLLKTFLNTNFTKQKKILLINPNHIEAKKNLKLLKDSKYKKFFSYVAPNYQLNSQIRDKKLINYIDKIKPKYILINIGGEKQEILAQYIYNHKKNSNLSILCLGAAIAFFTKSQAPINDLIDKFYLGWLIRFIYNPKLYYKRLYYSLKLIILFY
ncbi:WecB/TagA/CpsF family glycosyltransferase [Pelagibacteraceae bacterium]|nr:WecB/TagA/CpsF family glycosyltransferase [Pelagibacteraceae bacterium]